MQERMPAMATPAPVAFAEPRPNDVTWTHIVYALHALSLVIGLTSAAFVVTAFLTGLPSIVAVIMNYVRRSEVRGTYLESHFRWQIRTFWFALLWVVIAGAVSLPLMLVLVGFVTYAVAAVVIGVWVLYRVVRGWMRLADRSPMYA
jgi:uncharacterized membrane protein